MKLKQLSIHTSHSSDAKADLSTRNESVGQHFSGDVQTEKVLGNAEPGQFRWPGGFPTDRQLRIPAQIQRRFELISGVEINGRVWWGTGQEERLAFFAEVNWALAESKKEHCKSPANAILAASIMDQNRRAIAVEPDLFRKDRPSPEYEKARQQIRQLDGIPDPPSATKTPANKTGSRSLFGEQARQIERELSAAQRDQLLREGWKSSAPRPPAGSPQASLAIRGAIEKRLREGLPLFDSDSPGPEPEPTVDLELSSDTHRSSHPAGVPS